MIGEQQPLSGNIRSVTADGMSWISVERPSHAESEAIAREYDLIPSDVALALDRNQSAGLFRRDRYLLIVLQIPAAPSSERRHDIVTNPVAIFARPDILLTIHNGETRPLTRLFQHFEVDGVAREIAFQAGVGGVLFSLAQRLVDAFRANHAQLGEAIAVQEEEMPRSPTPRALGDLAHLRRETRVLRRLAAPLPSMIREIGEVELGLPAQGDWARLALRVEHLVEGLDDDLDALREIVVATGVATGLREMTQLRVLTAICATALPVIVAALLLGVVPGNPLAGQANGYVIDLAILGIVFLGTLLLLKRRGIV